MTISEYINQNGPFYHITPTNNLLSILENGLERRTCAGICVVRSDNPAIWENIINSQLDYSEYYAVIKLEPFKHNITINEVAPDSSEQETTGPLQNYIMITRIMISESDLVDRQFPRGALPNLDDLRPLIEALDGYVLDSVPDISILSQLEGR